MMVFISYSLIYLPTQEISRISYPSFLRGFVRVKIIILALTDIKI